MGVRPNQGEIEHFPMNQSELEANTCNWCRAQENARASMSWSVGVNFRVVEKVAQFFFNQSLNMVKQN